MRRAAASTTASKRDRSGGEDADGAELHYFFFFGASSGFSSVSPSLSMWSGFSSSPFLTSITAFGVLSTATMYGADTEPHVHASWGEWTPGDPSLLMLNIYPASGAITMSHIGFVVGDLAAAHARLVAANVAVVRAPEDRPWGRTAAYRDPDGNTVFLTEAPR